MLTGIYSSVNATGKTGLVSLSPVSNMRVLGTELRLPGFAAAHGFTHGAILRPIHSVFLNTTVVWKTHVE